MNSEKPKLPHIKSISIEKKGFIRKNVNLVLNGVLPSPAYSIDDIKFDVKNDTLTATPVMTYDPVQVVIQIPIYFEKSVDVKSILKEHTITTIRVLSDHGPVTMNY